ncbi:MAG TPA: class I fructose-bisphosphate aldolase [bacterium]|nr:class I fructose-bisphosphate aldolase [bacterium]
MNLNAMLETARALTAPGKGILAADESHGTIGRRFAAVGVENTPENRRQYRQLLFQTPGIADPLSGVILFDETIRQRADDGTPFPALLTRLGIVPGIKVDAGAKPLAGAPEERITEGLDGLRERLAEYRGLGARFAKWRAVIEIGEGRPSAYCLSANAHALGRYAALCQEADIVPIVEPEVLMDGAHTIEQCFDATEAALDDLFRALRDQRVVLEAVLLKPNMVVSGAKCLRQAGVEEVAEATVRCLRRTVPAAVPGVVFLSGGQSPERATQHLNAMNSMPDPRPWVLSFSFARALQAPALETWRGSPAAVEVAQETFLHRARLVSAAREGRYTAAMEQVGVGAGGSRR